MLAVIFNSFLKAFQNSSAEGLSTNSHQLPASSIFEASAKLEQGSRRGQLTEEVSAFGH